MLGALTLSVKVMADKMPQYVDDGAITPSKASRDLEKTKAFLRQLNLSSKPTVANKYDSGKCVVAGQGLLLHLFVLRTITCARPLTLDALAGPSSTRTLARTSRSGS